MKFFVLVLLIGFASASASSDSKLDKTADEDGMQNSPPLSQDKPLDFGDDATMAELRKNFANFLLQNMDQMKTDNEEGRNTGEEVMDKTNDHLKKGNENTEEKFAKLFDTAQYLAMNLIGNLQKKKRSADTRMDDTKNMFDPELLKETMGNTLGQDSQLFNQLLDMFKGRGGNEMMNVIQNLLTNNKDVQHGIKNIWEKAESFLKDLNIDPAEDSMKLGEGIEDTQKNQFKKSNDIFENIKNIAMQVIKRTKTVGNDIKEELLRKYKEDL